MKTLLTLLALLTFNQDFDPNKYLNNLINFKKYKKDILFMYKNMNNDIKIIEYFNNK